MKKELSICLVQLDLIWEDPEANREKIDLLLNDIKEVDIVVLPEMFTTGFTMDSEKFGEGMDGSTITWMKSLAKSKNAAICGSLIIKEEAFFNRFVFVRPDGGVEYYDKRHLFRMAGETEHFSHGKERITIEYLGWKINLQVCYDLRFPVFSRNTFINNKWDYDLLIYVANWPSPRSNTWRNLIEARAHENQCYVAAVNRVGTDGTGLDYLGDSTLISPKGEHLISMKQGAEKVDMANINMEKLEAFRDKFPIGLDADYFTIQT